MHPLHAMPMSMSMPMPMSSRFPHLVQFLAACTRPGHLCIVSEFMKGGSLYELIHGERRTDVPKLMRIAEEVSRDGVRMPPLDPHSLLMFHDVDWCWLESMECAVRCPSTVVHCVRLHSVCITCIRTPSCIVTSPVATSCLIACSLPRSVAGISHVHHRSPWHTGACHVLSCHAHAFIHQIGDFGLSRPLDTAISGHGGKFNTHS